MQIPLLEGRDFTIGDVEGEREGRDRQPPVRRALLPGRERRRQASRPGRRPEDRSWTSRSSASSPTRSTKGRAKASGGRCSCRTGARTARSFYVRTRRRRRRAPTALIRNEVQAARRGDAGLRDEDARSAARRDAADRPADRAALGRLRPARDAAGVDRPLRRDGVRRRAAQEGARHPPRARRAARRS